MSRHLLSSLLACTWLAACASNPPPSIPADESAPIPVPVEDKLDGKLTELLKLHESGSVQALRRRLKSMKDEGILHEGVAVKVNITATSAAVIPVLETALKKAGGRSETIFENILFGWVPIPALRSYAMQDEVWTIKMNVPSTSTISSPAASIPDDFEKQGVSHDRLQIHR